MIAFSSVYIELPKNCAILNTQCKFNYDPIAFQIPTPRIELIPL